MTSHDSSLLPRPPPLPADQGAMRTIMAADRTLMAWIRTALSMLSFGFTIYKFLEGVNQKDPLSHPDSPQRVGLLLAALGTLSMILGTFAYWQTLRDLDRGEEFRLGRPVLLIAGIITFIGAALTMSIAARLV
jgi:putative membrane protein